MTKLTRSSAGVFKRLTKDRVDKAMSNYKNQKADVHVWGVVESINSDGSYQVQIGTSSKTTRCASLCTANSKDRVLVLIKKDGRCVAVGRRGGDALGNDGQGDYLAGEGIRIENLVISADVTEDDLDAATEVIPTSWIENLD